jgi:hypothetical protein
VTFVVLSPVNQVNDVVDFVTGDRLQDLQIIVLLRVRPTPSGYAPATFLTPPGSNTA